MIDHLQTEADLRRAGHRRRWRIVRTWDGRSVAFVSRAPSRRATDTQIAFDVGTATLLSVSGHTFSLGGIAAVVERRHAAVAGFHSDSLIIRLSGAAHGTFLRHVVRVVDLDALFRIGRARLVHGGAPFDSAVDEPDVVGLSEACTTAMPAPEGLGTSHADASAFPIRAMKEIGRVAKMCRWTPSGLAMAHAIIFAQLESRTTTNRQIYDRIVVEWRPEWGRAPGYDTVRNWIRAARDVARDGRLRKRPEMSPRPALRGGDSR